MIGFAPPPGGRCGLFLRTRRAVAALALLSACAAPPPLPPPEPAQDARAARLGESVFLFNRKILRAFAVRHEAPRSTAVANRLSGAGEIPLKDGLEFAVTLADGRRLTDADFTAADWGFGPTPGGAGIWTNFRRDPEGLVVEVAYELDHDAAWIRKRVTLAAAGPAEIRIARVELERFRPPGAARAHPGSGRPAYVGDTFWFAEDPASENDVKEGTLSIALPLDVALGTLPVELPDSVVGAAPEGRVDEAFTDYLDALSVAPQ